ncbi:MAG: type II 3-dehydroquinate dehydratase [Bacteriovoracaceae bacterium]
MKNQKKILILHGPNLNFLGKRETHIYGDKTQAELFVSVIDYIKKYDPEATPICFQSNSEGAIIDYLYQNVRNFDAIIFNLAGYTHTSVALRDCLLGIKENKVYVEVHLTNPDKREEFRKTNYFRDIVQFYACGEGINSYFKAVDFLFKN